MVGVTVSIGLAANRLMAKIAAGPRQAARLRGDRRGGGARRCWRRSRCGCCRALARRWRAGLPAQGITLLGHLQALDDRDAQAPAGR